MIPVISITSLRDIFRERKIINSFPPWEKIYLSLLNTSFCFKYLFQVTYEVWNRRVYRTNSLSWWLMMCMKKKWPQKKQTEAFFLSHSKSAHSRGYSTKPLVSPNYWVSWHTRTFCWVVFHGTPKTFGPEHSFSHTCLRFAGINFSCRVPHCCPRTLQVPETSVNMSQQHHIQLLLSYSSTHLETPPGRCWQTPWFPKK